jgi:hypothetical protein
MLFNRFSIAGALSIVSFASAVAQEWKPVPSTYTNSIGYIVTEFTVRPTGSGCEGSQHYVKANNPSDNGTSRMTWATASNKDGGTLCSGGTWYYGGGSRAGQPGGKAPDVLIKGGRFYRRG